MLRKWRSDGTGDAETVRRVLSGGRDDFARLVERHLSAVHACAYARLGSHADAEDVAQETFLQAFRSLDRLRAPDKFGPWLLSIARNAALALAKHRRREQPLDAALERRAAAPGTDVEKAEMLQLVRDQVMLLEESAREVLLLHYFTGKTTPEMAELLELTPEAVRKRLQRAREALGERLLAVAGPALQPEHSENERARKVVAAIAAAPVAWQAGSAQAAAGSLKAALKLLLAKKAVLGAATGVAVLGAVAVWTPRPVFNPPAAQTASAAAAAAPATSVQAPAAAPTLPQAAPEPSTATPAPKTAPAPPLPRPEPGYGVVYGAVRDGSNMPMPNVKVTAHWVGKRPPYLSPYVPWGDTLTDRDGRFMFDRLPLGDFVIQALPDGAYASTSAYSSYHQFYSAAVLRPLPTGTLSGVVVDASGKPVPGAVVTPIRHQGPPEVEISARILQTTTDEAGRFTLKNMVIGKWTLCASAEGHGSVTNGFFTTGRDDLRLALARGLRLRGRLFESGTGNPVPGVRVRIYPEANEQRAEWRDVVSDADGRFDLGLLAPGAYNAWVEHDEFAPLDREAWKQFVLVKDRNDFDIEMIPGASVSGRVLDATTGRPMPGVAVSLNDDVPDHEVKSDAEGRFRIGGLAAGDYELYVKPGPGYPHPEQRHAVRVTLAASQAVEGTDLRVSHGGIVRGRVVDAKGEPVANALVGAEAAGAGFQSYYETGSDGTFRIVWPEATGQFYLHAVRGAEAATPVGPLTLGPDAPVDVTVTLHPCGTISGRVVDANGRPVPNKKVHPWPSHYAVFQSPAATTDGRGMFTCMLLWPDAYRMRVETAFIQIAGGGGYSQGEDFEKVEVGPGQDVTNLTLALSQQPAQAKGTLTITGRVTDGEGNPIAGADVFTGMTRVTTDANGAYTLSGLQEGACQVEAATRDHFPVRQAATAGSSNVDFVLERPAKVTGQVLREEFNEPLVDFEVAVMEGKPRTGDPYWPGLGLRWQKVHADDGRFSIEYAKPGESTLLVRGADIALTLLPVDVPPLREGPAEFTVRVNAGETLRGVVTDDRGRAVSGARIHLGAQPPVEKAEAMAAAHTAADGSFRIEHASPGPWVVSATHPDYATASTTVDSAASLIQLRLTTPGVVEGVVTLSGQPAKAHVSIRGVDSIPGAYGSSAETGADGSYRVERVAPGRVSIYTIVLEEGMRHSVVAESQREADVAAGQTTRVDFPFGGEGAVEGRITAGGQPVQARLGFEFDAEKTHYSAATDPQGVFQRTGLPTGPAKVRVSAELPGGLLVKHLEVQVTAQTRIDTDFPGTGAVSIHVTGTKEPFVMIVPGRQSVPSGSDPAFDETYQRLCDEVAGYGRPERAPTQHCGALEPGTYTVVAIVSWRDLPQDPLQQDVRSAVVEVLPNRETPVDLAF